jgi:hypothetical protein
MKTALLHTLFTRDLGSLRAPIKLKVMRRFICVSHVKIKSLSGSLCRRLQAC